MFTIKKKTMNGEGFVGFVFSEDGKKVLSEGVFSKPNAKTYFKTYEEAWNTIEKAKSIYRKFYALGYLSAEALKDLTIEGVE